MTSKADYVKAAPNPHPFDHTCHWPGCETKVKPAMWGCSKHWFKLPLTLRNKVWRAYRPGQEVSKTPSREYLEVAREVQAWIEANAGMATAESRSTVPIAYGPVEAIPWPEGALCIAMPTAGVIVWRSGVKLDRVAAGVMLLCFDSLLDGEVAYQPPFLELRPKDGRAALVEAMTQMGWA